MSNDNRASHPAWPFRVWHGMTLKPWFGLLARNRFAVSFRRLPTVVEITIYAALNSLFAAAQRAFFGRAIERTAIAHPPVFIVGHWRTGTTWLHEMLARDPRFVAPTTYECLAPAHALVTAPIWPLSRFRMPKTRPMDGMPVNHATPQEDEFAMMNLGAGSLYETLAFPNRRPVRADYLDIDALDTRERNRWIADRIRFAKQVLYRARRSAPSRRPDNLRLVLKAPHDTARLALLNSIFPGACFIHLVRDPTDVFASTMKLWRSLGEAHALQTPDWGARPDGTPALDELVLSTFEALYRNFDEARRQLPANQIIDVRYEEMSRDPAAMLNRIYTHFGWDGLDAEQTVIRGEPARHYEIAPQIGAAIARRWGFYRERFGYSETRDAAA